MKLTCYTIQIRLYSCNISLFQIKTNGRSSILHQNGRLHQMDGPSAAASPYLKKTVHNKRNMQKTYTLKVIIIHVYHTSFLLVIRMVQLVAGRWRKEHVLTRLS